MSLPLEGDSDHPRRCQPRPVPTRSALALKSKVSVGHMHFKAGLSKGYLPQELPPCFTSTDFAAKAGGLVATKGSEWTYPAKFSLTRAGGLRRSAEIPNPFSQLNLTQFIAQHWQPLQRITAQSHLSLSRPVRPAQRTSHRSLSYRQPIDQWARALVSRMPGGRLTLKTDISQFYPSVYTHAVDWAVRGKASAKRNLRASALGPDLDKLLRVSRGGQTIGLSIGPDTSWLVAEVVLARVDSVMQKRFPSAARRCARFGDDMTFYASSHGEAHEFLAHYQNALLAYELAINPTKVAIIDGLEPVEAPWVRQLRTHRYRDWNDQHLASDLVDLFGAAFEERAKHPTQGVLSYAIKRCDPFPAGSASWPVYRDLVLASVGLEPSTLRHAYEILAFARDHGLQIKVDRVADVLNELALQHAALDHGFEVSWILFILRELGLSVDGSTARKVAEMDDAPSLILLRDAYTHSRSLQSAVDWTQAVRRAEADGALSSNDWLLAYEFRHHRWARPRVWDRSQAWKSAHTAQVSFFKPSSAPPRSRLKRRRPRFAPSWHYP